VQLVDDFFIPRTAFQPSRRNLKSTRNVPFKRLNGKTNKSFLYVHQLPLASINDARIRVHPDEQRVVHAPNMFAISTVILGFLSHFFQHRAFSTLSWKINVACADEKPSY
jgi:hypothetical protein